MELPCYCGLISLDTEHCANVRDGTPVCSQCVARVDTLLIEFANAIPRASPTECLAQPTDTIAA
jgi:hypothetical protein